MRWLALITGIALISAGLYLRWSEPEVGPLELVADLSSLRSTSRGPVIGGMTPGGALAWLGIPYAAPPTGELRWRAPQRVEGWATPRDTLRFSAVCPQLASRLSASTEEPGTLVGDEDCLYLNVFAPAGLNAGARLPVMVFVHGGGNTIGSAIPYDATTLAQEQGVVVVTLHYRLGILGWFSHQTLRDQDLLPEDASGNFGLLDIVAALRWVARDIDAFGGDPNRVTVFGESAGARNIYALLATPLAAGLFHGAIIQSGFPGTYSRALAENATDDTVPGHPNSSGELVSAWITRGREQTPEETDAELSQMASGELLAYLRGLSTDALFAAITRDSPMYSVPALVRDGAVLPETPLPTIFGQTTAWNRVPVLAGTNRDEMKLFMALSGRHTYNRLGLIPTLTDPDQYELLARVHSDAWKAAGVDLPLAAISRGDSDQPVFAYRFDWDDSRKNLFVDLPALLGAAHGMELDLIFQPLLARVVPGLEHAGNRVSRAALGKTIRDYWGGFAYSGRPGSGRSGSQVAWPTWRHDAPQLMLLDEPGDGGVRAAPLTLSIEDVKAALAAETGLPERLRCAVYADLYLFNSGLSELFDLREYQAMGCAQFPTRGLRGLSY